MVTVWFDYNYWTWTIKVDIGVFVAYPWLKGIENSGTLNNST